ncbi:MAG: sulfatase [Planctomycetota bacterium]
MRRWPESRPGARLVRSLGLGLTLLLAANCAAPGPSPPDPEDERPWNVLLLCVDDLRPELASFGVDYIESPHIDRLASESRAFTRHYVQAPTCGASRYALLTGRYADAGGSRGNNALVQRAEAEGDVPPTLPGVFRDAGYTTVSIGKVSHHPGGRYGEGWNDPAKIELPGAWTRHSMPAGEWGTPRGTMHALAAGHVRKAGVTPALESFDGPDESYPDGLVARDALAELERLAGQAEPFLLAVGFIRPHLPFGAPARYMQPYEGIELPPIPQPQTPAGRTTWHRSGEFFGQYVHGERDPRSDAAYADELRRHYAACVTYVDALVGRVLARLEQLDLARNTVVVLWGDHGWHLGEHSIWGKHALFEESLRSPLIVRAPGLARPGVHSDAVVETIDVFPTLCELTGVAPPPELDGSSLGPQLARPAEEGDSAVAYRHGAETIRTDRYRLIRHVEDGATAHVELYDHTAPAAETENVAAAAPEVVERLLERLAARLR